MSSSVVAFVGVLGCTLVLARPATGSEVATTWSDTVSSRAPRCDVTIDSQRVLRLPNGELAYVSPASRARARDGTWMVTGTPVLVLTPGSTGDPTSNSRVVDDIGLTISPLGAVALVPRPPAVRNPRFSRVVPGKRGWQVMLFDSVYPDDNPERRPDTMTVWLGDFVDGQWGPLTRIARVVDARIRPEMSSRLLQDERGELALVYPLDTDYLGPKSRVEGVVLLHGSGEHWKEDTLFISRWPVTHVTALPGSKPGTWIALFRHRIKDPSTRDGAVLFLAKYDERWGPPHLALRGSRGHEPNQPLMWRRGNELYATWWQLPSPDDTSESTNLRWSRLDTTRTAHVDSAVVVPGLADNSRVEALPGPGALWTMRDSDHRSVRWIYLDAEDRVHSGRLPLTNDATFELLPTGSTKIGLLTTRLGEQPADNPIEQTFSYLNTGCHR